jgi:hypothetical protein
MEARIWIAVTRLLAYHVLTKQRTTQECVGMKKAMRIG